MEIITNKTTIEGEDLKSRLLQRKTMNPRFRWPLTHNEAVNLLLSVYRIEVKLRNGDFQLDEATKQHLNRVGDILIAEKKKSGIMFCGLCGNGKTTMIHAMQKANNYLMRHKMISDKMGMRIIDAREINRLCTDSYEDYKKVKDYETALAIDDLGTEPSEVLDYGNVISPLVELLEYRYSLQKFTIITTNMTPKDIQTKYGCRVADRFNEMMQVIAFKNESYRNKSSFGAV